MVDLEKVGGQRPEIPGASEQSRWIGTQGKIFQLWILLAVLLHPVSCLAEQCAGEGEIVDPEPFRWEFVDGIEPHYVGTMEIAETELVLGGDTIHTRVYRQQGGCDSIPGPTLNMVPGEKYVLRFRNRLPYEPPSHAHNVFKDPNVSNLHTHGVHISGESPGDDVTRSFPGGAGGDFVYDIPEDHMGGTFWYHAHHHGSTYLQVSGGAFGLIVLDDSDDNIPPAVAAMEERQLVVAYLDPDVAGTGGDTLISGSLSPTWTVNGSIDGTLVVPPDTWQHWRVLLADRDARAKTFGIGPQCEVALMARDGVWRTEVPKALPNNAISLTGASRADLAVRCAGDSTLSVGDTIVARVHVKGAADRVPGPYRANGESWWSARPGYLRDLRNTVPAGVHSILLGATTINGSKYNPLVPTFTLNAEGVQQFELMGASNHPFHMHIYHVQVQAGCGEYEGGEYYDVVSENCSVRFDLSPATSSPYNGRTIMHCHILRHEDLGSMGWVNVKGGQGAPVFPADSFYVEFIEPLLDSGRPPEAPSNLLAESISSSEIRLTWTDNSDNESLFTIERTSAHGFDFLDSVEADVTHYVDGGLDANTTYIYSIYASNSEGNSERSGTASTITEPGDRATALMVRAITVSSYLVNEAKKGGRVRVEIEDNIGRLVPGAEVTGTFSGTLTENDLTAMTGLNGSATIDTLGAVGRRDSLSFEFCVTRVTGAGLKPWEPTDGSVNCALQQFPVDPWSGERFLLGRFRDCHWGQAWTLVPPQLPSPGPLKSLIGTWPTICRANNRFSLKQRLKYRP